MASADSSPARARRRRRFVSLPAGSTIVRLPNQISGKPGPLSTGAGDFFLRARRFHPTAGPPRSRYSGDSRDRGSAIPPGPCRGPGAVSLDQSSIVVPTLELLEGLNQLGDGREVMD